MITSAVGNGSVTLQCEEPVIVRSSNSSFTVTCSFPTSGVTIYYTTDGSTPTTSSNSTTSGGTVSCSFPATIKAIAAATNYSNSTEASAHLTQGMGGDGSAADPYTIEYQDDVTDFITKANTAAGADKHYKVIASETLNFSGAAAITQEFSGTFDGGYCVITDLTHALFNTINGGTVKNVKFSGVNITTGDNVGVICDEADGMTKIYNCGVLSGSVDGGTNVGGLVGLINSDSSVRVVNCYNYADVSGSSYAAGIVGKNEGTVGDVRIALCMMYGSVSGASNISPVYGGNHLPNVSDFTEYNYWRYNSGLTYTSGKYNDQLAIDNDEYLTRFPFYRHILNTHREMASYFLFGDYTTEHVGEIGHWVLDKTKAPYPIVEEWQTNTRKVLDASPTNIISSMGTNGYLAVTVNIGSHSYSASLPITDMDEENYDYTWGKVVLPFANEFEVNTDYTKVCTGWKITGITGGTTGTFSNFNVSDRDCTAKDLFSTTGFIFAQGGNYIVPYNVTAIEITANFATAYYLSDENYDIGYSGDTNASGYTGRTGLAGSTPNDYHGQTVYKTLASALSAMSASGSTHEQAVVLVGNYHQDNGDLTTANGYTIMSIDADNNQELDYAIYSNYTTDRPAIPPTRFDFVAMIPIGMSSHINGSKFYPNIPIFKPRGWFELTETSLLRADQFELDSNNFNTSESETRNYRCIINGGYFTQMVRSNANACTKVSYFQIGGKAYIKEFYPGNHSTKFNANKLVPINVTGGEIEQCFMTGYGKGKAYGTDIYFWCAGGKIGKFLGANMEPVYQTNSNTLGNVNLTAKIDHAIIGRFFGGGTSPKARVTGNINVTINNSHVDFYCGGPEFGDMEKNKTVTTEANNTYFKEYYGAGFGGTAITYTNDKDVSTNLTLGNNNYPSGYFSECYIASSSTDKGRLKYKTDYGIGSCYKFEFVMHSRGHQSVSRFFTGYSMFSLATTGSVTNVLNDCEIETDFYGAGCQGKVNGTVTSTLTDCIVHGSAFGGGFKAVSNQVDVYPATSPTLSSYNSETCIFSDFGTVAPETYEWVQGTSEKKNTADETNKKLYTGTNVTLTELGNVTGAISITINGGKVSEDVFGGGNESKSLDNTTVNLKGNATIYGDVFGGGNKGHVEGSAKVNIMVPDPPVTP